MFALTVTPDQRLKKNRITCMSKDPTIAGILMVGSCEVVSSTRPSDRDVRTACTNGRDEWYSEEFMAKLTDAELRFVVMHEGYHKAFRHLITWAHLWAICPDTANRSMDYYINVKLYDTYIKLSGGATDHTFIKMPSMVLFDEQYRGWDTAKIFWHIYKKKKEREEEEGEEDGEGGDGGTGGNGGTGDDDGSFDEHDWEGAKDMSDQEKKDLEKEIDDAVRQGELAAGKDGTGGDRDFDELLQPQVNWREATREFIVDLFTGNDFATYRRPNRRFMSAGVYLPSGISEKIGELAILIDTSGSTYAPNVLPAFMGELQSIAQTVNPSRVHIIYWDTKVCGAEVYEEHELDTIISSTEVEGGGGTDITCVNEYMTKNNIKPQASIVLTDGYLFGGWGTWDHPLLWCIIDNKGAKPTHGKALHITASTM